MKIRIVLVTALLSVLIWTDGAPAQQADDYVWVRQDATFMSNGEKRLPKNPGVKAGQSDFTATSQGKSNSCTWDEPPAILKPGDLVTMKIHCSTNDGAPLIATILSGEVSESPASGPWDPDVCSYKGGMRKETFNDGSISFKFKPGLSPWLGVRVGRSDDYAGEMSSVITWAYVRTKASEVPKHMGDLYVLGMGWESAHGSGNNKEKSAINHDDASEKFTIKAGAQYGYYNEGGSYEKGGFRAFPPPGPVSIQLFWDDQAVGSGEADGAGQVAFRFTLPDSTPQGRSSHTIKAIATLDKQRAEQKLAVEVQRDLSPIVVTASTSASAFHMGDRVEVKGMVYKDSAWQLPVRAKIVIETTWGAPVTTGETDDSGQYSVTGTIFRNPENVSQDLQDWIIHAYPIDKNSFADGSQTLNFHLQSAGTILLTATSDKAVYDIDETINLTGTLVANGKPHVVPINVLFDTYLLAKVTPDAAGAFKYSCTMATVEQVFKRRMFPGYHSMTLAAQAPEFAAGTEGTHEGTTTLGISIQDKGLTDGAQQQQVNVLAVSGYASAKFVGADINTPGGPGSAPRKTLRAGDKLTDGTEIQTSRTDSRVTLSFPMDNGADIAVLIQPGTKLQIGHYSKDKNGRYKLRLYVSSPGYIEVSMRNPNPGDAPLDYQFITAKAVVNSIHTKYRIEVAADGATTITGIEGEAIVNPIDPKYRPVSVPAGQTVRVPDESLATGPAPASPALSTPGVKTSKSAYAPNEPIVVEYLDPNGSPRDWISIARARDGDQSAMDRDLGAGNKWSFLRGDFSDEQKQKPATHQFEGLPEGEYEARYISWAGGSNKATSKCPFKVGKASGVTQETPPPPKDGAKPAPPTIGQSITIDVPAKGAWTNTGVMLTEGMAVRIEASGTIEASSASDGRIFYHSVPPAGRDEFFPYDPQPQLRALSLIGKIGEAGRILPVGTYIHILSASGAYGTGELMLGINDDTLDDNSGAWRVKITVLSAGSQPAGAAITGFAVRPRRQVFERDTPIVVDFSSEKGNPRDNIAIAADGAGDQANLKMVSTGGKDRGSVTFEAMPRGYYEMRYIGSDSVVKARQRFSVELTEVFAKSPRIAETPANPGAKPGDAGKPNPLPQPPAQQPQAQQPKAQPPQQPQAQLPKAQPPQQPVSGDWVCAGAEITNGNGEKRWADSFKPEETRFVFTRNVNGKDVSNTMTWTPPPLTLRIGQEVYLTMTSTTNPEPYISGWWNIACRRNREATGENGASSNPNYRKDSPHTGTIKFVFDPDATSSTTSIEVSAGNAGGDGGPSTYVLVKWVYRKQK